MQIKDVEKQTGLTKRSIKLYEEKGLLKPEKNEENGYRNYIEADVECLRKIKMYRSLEFSIDEIKLILMSSDEKEEIYLAHLKEIELKINQYQMARSYTMQLKDDETIEDTDSVRKFMEDISENSEDTYWNPHINLSELPLWTALIGGIVASFLPSYFFTWYIICAFTILTTAFATGYFLLKNGKINDNNMTENIMKTFAMAFGLLDYEFLFFKLFNIGVDVCIKKLGEEVTLVSCMQLLGLGLIAIVSCMIPLVLYVIHVRRLKKKRSQ